MLRTIVTKPDDKPLVSKVKVPKDRKGIVRSQKGERYVAKQGDERVVESSIMPEVYFLCTA